MSEYIYCFSIHKSLSWSKIVYRIVSENKLAYSALNVTNKPNFNMATYIPKDAIGKCKAKGIVKHVYLLEDDVEKAKQIMLEHMQLKLTQLNRQVERQKADILDLENSFKHSTL